MVGGGRTCCWWSRNAPVSDGGSRCGKFSKLWKTSGLGFWTRSQCLRTLLDHVFAFELRDPPETPVYQRIAAQAAEMRAGGAAFHAIAEHFGVDDHTAADAVRWFHGEL